MELVNALSMEGPLQKQSPNLFKLFQARYFAIRSQGQYLVWFKKKPTTIDQKPKGILQINTINQCIPEDSDQRIFTLSYGQRQFVLRADNVDTRDRWVRTIQILMQHQKKLSNFKKGSAVKNQSWRWDGVNQEISQKIRIQNQKILLSQGDNQMNQKSQNILIKILKHNHIYQFQKGIIHGFHKKKGIIQSNSRWYFLCSNFNLQDQEDQPGSHKLQQFLQQLNKQNRKLKKNKNNKKQESDQSSSQQDQEIDQKQQIKCNIIYEFDQQTHQVKHLYPIENIISWEIDTSQTPNKLIIKYQIPIKDPKKALYQEPKQGQLILLNDYLVQLKKWQTAINILYEKIGVKALRQKKRQKIGQKIQIDAYKIDIQGFEWIEKTKDHSLILFITKDSIRIDQNVYYGKNISEIQKEQVQIIFKQLQVQKKQGKRQVLKIIQKGSQQSSLYIFCQKGEALKNLFKKVGKLLKNVQKQSSKQMMTPNITKRQSQSEINPKTFYLDKLMKERSNTIKVNFYDYMQRDPKQHQRKPKPQPGFWDKIMGMFCGNSQQDDIFS